MVFVLIASISAGAISVKKQLKNYAIYYICGFRWSQCAGISLVHSVIISVIALVLTISSMWILQISGRFTDTAMHMGIWQFLVCVGLQVFFVLVSWLLPMSIVRGTSVNQVLRKNN